MSLPTPEEFAREALGCLRAVVEPGRTAAGTAYCLRHDYPWLQDADTCPVAERVSVSIAARDEQVRADERARVSVVHSTLTDEQLVAELVRRGVLRELDAPTLRPGDRVRLVDLDGREFHRTIGPGLKPDPQRLVSVRADDLERLVNVWIDAEGYVGVNDGHIDRIRAALRGETS